MIVKIVTDCNFYGCSTTHFIEVKDNTSKKELDELAREWMENDIQPTYYFEEVYEDEEPEENYNC